MKNSRGANLRAVPVQPDPAPGAQQIDAPPELSTSPTPAGVGLNSGLDDLQNLPDSPIARPIAPTGGATDSHAEVDHDDLNELPDAGGQLGHVYDAVYHGDPDNVAKVLDTSKKLGADPQMVAGSLKDASKAANGPDQNFFQAIENKFPGTTKFLQTPQNMAVAHDDLPNVAQHEDLIEKVKSAFASEGNALKGGVLQEELAMLRSQQLHGETEIKSDSFRLGGMAANALGAPNDTLESRAAWIQGQLDEINKSKPGSDSGWIKRGIYGATEFLPQIASGVMSGLKMAAPAGLTAAAAGAFLGPGDVIPATTAAGIGFGVGEADYNYRLMSGMAYDSLKKVKDVNGQPLPDNIVRITSMATGAAAAMLGMVKLGAVLESIPGGKEFMQKFTSSVPAEVLQNSATRSQALKNFASNYVTSVAHGTAAMTGITAVNILGERGAEAASGQEFDHSKEPGIASQLLESAKDAASTFGIMGGVGPVVMGVHDMQAARRAQTNREFYTALGETAEASKLRQRLPEAHRELLDGLTKDGPIEHLYVPQEAFQSYFQGKNIDPEVVANELGVQDSYAEAQKTGGDIKIPTAVWASKVAGTEHYQGLANDIKFDPQDLTSNEVERRKSEIAEQMKQEDAKSKEGVEPVMTASESASRIHDERYQQLLDAGLTPAEAKQGATLHEAAFRTLGDRLGQDPYELAKRFQLEIQRRGEMGGDDKTQVLSADDAQAAMPSEVNTYAPTDHAFLEKNAAINKEVEELRAKEQTPEVQARLEELAGQRKELLQEQQKSFHQSDQKPETSPLGFYSQLEHEVTKMDFKQMPAKDLANRINNIQGLKKEELEFTGLSDWLKAKDGKVSKEEVLQFIKDNGVKVEQIVKAEKLGDSGEGVDWGEKVRDHSRDDEDYSNELEYYSSEEFWGESRTEELRNRLAPNFTDEAGTIDEGALSVAMDREKEREAEAAAQEAVDSDNYHNAQYKVEEQNSGHALYGNDEMGWWHQDIGHMDVDLEEAKVRLLSHLLEKGTIEGNLADHIHPEDIKWKRPSGEKPSDATLKKKGKELFAREKERFIEAAKETNAFMLEPGKDYSKKQYEKEVLQDAKNAALYEAEEAYDKTDNPKNKVTVELDHGVLEGRIKGNDAKGYSFELDGKDVGNDRSRPNSTRTAPQEFPLEAKTLDEAKAEVNKVLLDNGKISERPGDTKDINRPTGGTKWSKYKVPGGENYREVLLTLPNVGPEKFQYTTHFDEKNILAHVRLTDRVDSQGRKTLFIEEMQSDWHQQGRESGYQAPDAKEKIAAIEKQIDEMASTRNFKDYMAEAHPEVSAKDVAREFKVGEGAGFSEWKKESKERSELYTKLNDERRALKSGVPNAPFKNTDAWAGLALKRMIRMAVEQGYEALAWSPADVHVARWGTDNVSWVKKDDHWLVGSAEQRGGNADGTNIEELARRRGELLERNGDKVTSKEELQKVIASTLGRERDDRSLESLTDRVWKQMQGESSNTGAIEPRKEGMEFFYNKMIPDAAKKILKKMDPDAKIEVGKIGTDPGVTHADVKYDQIIPETSMDALEIPLTDKVKESANAGFSLFQGENEDSARGKITFQNERAMIQLFKNADRSTFLHESGHYFLEIMQSLAADENGPQQIKEDMQAVREWMGLKDGEAIGTKQHEKFARGFEQYLREGEAPSAALAKAFAKFKQWLVQIYRSAKNLNVELSPQIREVMDRLLATDDEIRQAQEGIGFHQGAGKEVPASVEKRINSLAEQAREKAESTLMREQMKELSESNKQFIAGEKARLQAEGEAKAAAEPVFKAQHDIQEAIGPRRKVLALAGKMLDGTIKPEDAAHFEVAAEVNGFIDGESLANEILASAANGAKEKIVQAHVEEGMRPHANLMDKMSIKEQAMKAVHNEHMTELLALEKQIFESKMNEATTGAEVSRRQRVEARIAAAEAKKQAKEILDAKPIREAGNFRIYTTAERNAAIKADAAVKRKDFERAAEYKRQQMLNHALAAEAMRNRDEVEKAEKFLNKSASRDGDLKDMPYAFNKQVDKLLERFGVKEKSAPDQETMLKIATDMQGKGETMDDIANATGMVMDKVSGQFRPEEIRDFVTRVNENYVGLQLPESILSGAGASDYRDLKMGDLRDLQAAVKTITSLGKKYDRFLNEFIQIDMKQAAMRFKNSVVENIGTPYGDVRKLGDKYSSPIKKMVENIKNIPNGMISSMVNTLTLCTYLDGGEINGPAHDYIYRPMKQAEDRKFARYAKMREEIPALFSKFYDPKELADYKKKVTEHEGRAITKEQILSIALNWGNEQNRDRIRAGFGSRDEKGRLIPLSDAAIQDLFKHLGKKDWEFAQAAWDHLETYWPEIAALEMKIRGVEPERVVPAPFENEHGSFKGGYYPIAYDFEKSNEAFKNEQQKTELYKSYSAASAQTEQGHAISRVAFVARPVRLSMDVFFNHLENVIHDLEFRPAVIDVNKFLNMPDVKNGIQNAIGMDAFRGMESWLQGIASDQSENLTWLDKAMTWTRFGTTISALGMTPKAFLLHAPSNVFNAMWETGVQNTVRFMTKAALDVAMGRGDLKTFVFDRSERMKQRLTVRDRDIMDMAKAWQGTAAGVIPHYAFLSLHLADEAVSVPLWADTYQKNVAEHGEKKAAEIADETVTRTLGSGSKVDQIGFQRGGPTKKMFTMFYSWMSVMFNRAWLDGKMAGLEYKEGNVGQAASILAKATFYAWALPAVHEALLSQAMQNKPGSSAIIPSSDEEKKQFVGKIIEHPFAMIPFVRDIAQPIIHKALGEHGGDYKMSPVEMALQNIYSPLADGAHIAFTDGKHFDEKYAEQVARGMSQVAGYPQQLNTWAFNFMDYVQNNGEASMKDFLSRRRKK